MRVGTSSRGWHFPVEANMGQSERPYIESEGLYMKSRRDKAIIRNGNGTFVSGPHCWVVKDDEKLGRPRHPGYSVGITNCCQWSCHSTA